MIDQQHPITPPLELVHQWADMLSTRSDHAVFSLAAQWGADQELEACIEWQKYHLHSGSQLNKQLRVARRPEPPSLKEQALEQLDGIATCFRVTHGGDIVCDKIRAVLEALPND
jgi:hypothetical protein